MLTGKSGSGWVALTGLLSSMAVGAPAWAAPVVLDEVALESTSDGLRIELRGDGAMPAEAVNVKTDDGVVYLYVRGTRVHADRRSWPSELGVIKAHRHHSEIELVVPTGGRTCAASPSFETTQTGLTAVLTCSAGATSTGEARRAARAAAKAAAAAATETSETRPKKPAPAPTSAVVDDDALPSRTGATRAEKPVRAAERAPAVADVPNLAEVKAMVALPAEPKPETSTAAKSPSVQPAPSGGAAPASKSATNPPAAPGDTIAAPPETAAAPSSEKEAGATTSAPTSESPGHGLLPAFLVLVAGAGGAALWWKKKRGLGLPKRIQIRETASLGPKRSLVVAEIDGERVILASSEAGITLLQPPASSESLASPAAPGLAWAAAAAPRTERAPSQPEAAAAPSILSATTALFASPEPTLRPDVAVKESAIGAEIGSGARDQVDELEGAASGLARLRSLTGGLATKPPAKGPTASVKAPTAFANKAPSAAASQAASAFANKAPSAVAMKDNDRLDDDWFDEILEDSVEDQELRAKLAAGVGGRVK